ncbi:MAG: lanthionine synthetase LanC family protein [Woeseiaceae bacterium]
MKQALWQGGACNWRITLVNRERDGNVVVRQGVAPVTVYVGTAGIALFLLELFRMTGGGDVRRVVEGALHHSMSRVGEVTSAQFGLFTGRIGVAYVLARSGAVLGVDHYVDEAKRILSGLADHEHDDPALDVIAGAAGAIAALLKMREVLEPALPLEMAERLGEKLLRYARCEPIGWSWPGQGGSAIRNLTGFAHGASGIGSALLELHAATGKGNYRYAAEQAFAYERQFYSNEVGNWPDFRNMELWGHPPGYMWAWCHGAPGIALARIRAYEITDDPVYKSEALAAVKSTMDPFREQDGNYSLCHGVAGNSDVMLEAADTFHDEQLRERVEQRALIDADTHELKGTAWPCGTKQGADDPGLMLGEAGIGSFFLKLAGHAPSILLIRGAGDSKASEPDASYTAMQQRHIDAFFGRTRRILECWPPDEGGVETGILNAENGGSAVAVTTSYDMIRDSIQGQTDPIRRLRLEDAFLVEAVRYRMTWGIQDYCEDTLRELTRCDVQNVNWNSGKACLSQNARLFETKWDWDAFLKTDFKGGATPAQPFIAPACWDGVPYVAWRHRGVIRVRKLTAFAAVVLKCVRVPTALPEIVAKMANHDSDTAFEKTLTRRVRAQLANGLRAGIVDWDMAPAWEGRAVARKARKQ